MKGVKIMLTIYRTRYRETKGSNNYVRILSNINKTHRGRNNTNGSINPCNCRIEHSGAVR